MAAAGPPCRPPPRCCRWQCALGEAPNFPPTLNPVSGAVFADAHSGGSVLPGLLSAPSTLAVLANFYFLFHICKHKEKNFNLILRHIYAKMRTICRIRQMRQIYVKVRKICRISRQFHGFRM